MFKRRNRLSTQLHVENLEIRNLLSAAPIIVAAAAPGSFQADHSAEAETHLFASLTDPANAGASAKVQYESEQEGTTLQQSFSVQVRGAEANATLDVTIDGVVVGQVSTDANGVGRLRLTDHGKGPNAQPIPADFPAVADGSAVSVGTLTGAFTAQDVGEHHDPPTPPTPHVETHLTAKLTDPNDANAKGGAGFESETEHGQTTASFGVLVAGAGANQTLDVAIDGAVVGQITTDALGVGKLKISPTPAGFPTVAAGSVVTVGTAITGTLAVPAPGGDHGGGDDQGGDDDHHGDGDQGDGVETHLAAKLADPNNANAKGVAGFESETEHGQTTASFGVLISGAEANKTLDVAIDGTVVGQITTDALGVGKLKISPTPAGFPTVAAGSVVTVGTAITGTLAVPTPGGDHGGGDDQAGDDDHHGDGDHGNEVETHLFARLTDPASAAASAKVQYESEQEGTGPLQQSLSVQVRGAAANATLDVTIDGVVVGQVTTDAAGIGRLRLSDHGNAPGQLSIPADFPAVAEGSAITVGSLAGAFVAQPFGDHPGPVIPPVPPVPPVLPAAHSKVKLDATLADPTNAATTGKAQFESETEHGRTAIAFAVEIRGAAANQSLDVAIDGVVVGQLKTGALGGGVFKIIGPTLPAGFPTVSAGSIVTVGTSLSGKLAAHKKG